MPKQTAQSKKTTVVSKTDYVHLAAFRNALREFLHFSEEAALESGVPPQQHQAMLAIRGTPGSDHLTVGELARRLKIKHHSAVGLANRMEADRLITKKHDLHDRRQVFIRLTPHGRRTLEKLSTAHKAELVHIGPVLRKIFTHLKTVS